MEELGNGREPPTAMPRAARGIATQRAACHNNDTGVVPRGPLAPLRARRMALNPPPPLLSRTLYGADEARRARRRLAVRRRRRKK